MRIPPGWRVYWWRGGSPSWPSEPGWHFAPVGQRWPRFEDWGDTRHYDGRGGARTRKQAVRRLRAELISRGTIATRSPEDIARAPLRSWLCMLLVTRAARLEEKAEIWIGPDGVATRTVIVGRSPRYPRRR